MKSILGLLLVIALISFGACADDDDTTPPDGGIDATVVEASVGSDAGAQEAAPSDAPTADTFGQDQGADAAPGDGTIADQGGDQ